MERNPKVTTHPAFTLVGLNYYGQNKNDEIQAMWDTFIHRMDEIKNLANSGLSYGLCGGEDDTRNFNYMSGLPVFNTDDVPDGMEIRRVPEQLYVVLQSTLADIGETHDYFYQTWMPDSEYERDNGPDFELYSRDFSREKPVLGVYIPIRKKP